LPMPPVARVVGLDADELGTGNVVRRAVEVFAETGLWLGPVPLTSVVGVPTGPAVALGAAVSEIAAQAANTTETRAGGLTAGTYWVWQASA
jgi:hypothetical protein